MNRTWVLAVLALVVMGGLTSLRPLAAQVGDKEKDPGDKRNGEEEQILEREKWFAERRGLGTLLRPGALRQQAVEEVRFRLSQQLSSVIAAPWQSVGPTPMNMLSWSMGRVAGRVSALAVHPSNEQTLYLGTASGGLWKTVNGGTSWTPLFDAVGTETIGSVALDPNDANVVWVGTGEQGENCTDYFGMGLFRSADAGLSFQPRNGSGASALDLSYVTSVAVQPGNSNVVLAGGPGFCSGGVRLGGGLYRSTDGGQTWSLRINGQANDILFDPVVPATVYTSISNAGVFKSTDGGASWTQLANGIPSGTAVARLRVAMAPSNRQVLYALVNRTGTTTGLYRSLDGGASWSLRNSNACDGQCRYNLSLDVSPASSDTVLLGTIRIWRSTNGGSTLSVLTSTWGSGQRVHQDTHVVRYSRANSSRFWVGSDGGLWRTDNGGSSYSNLNSNLSITQFYDIAVHPTSSSRIFGGAQDNSSSGRSASAVWDVVTVTGDGFTNAVDAGNFNYVFIESYPTSTGPNIYRSTNGGGVSSFSSLPKTGISQGAGSFPWKTEFVLLPAGSTSYLVTGSTHLYRANARAGTVSWTRISDSLTGSAVSAMGTFSPGSGMLYVGTGGRIFRTANALLSTVTWTEVTGDFPGGTVSDLAVDPTDRLRVFATRSTFGGGKLYRSATGGTTWAAVGNGLPDVPANSVAIDPGNRQRIFVATDVGVFVSEDGGDTFSPQMSGLPQGTVVTDLEIDDAPHLLSAGTYGRGAWQLALPAESAACVVDGGADDTLSQTSCCSGTAVSGSTFCLDPADAGGSFASCHHICGTVPQNGCIPAGGVDDVNGNTTCCTGQAVADSVWCLDPTDWGTDWTSCVQTCQ